MEFTHETIDAGGIQCEALYNRRSPRDPSAPRAEKKNESSPALRRMNQIRSVNKLTLLLSKNFPTAGSGLVVTLTFDDRHMPKTRKEAQRRFKYFLKKLREARRKAGLPEPVVFFTPEVLTSASGRWHYHIILDNTGRDLDIIRACWIYGSDIEAEKLRVDFEKNHSTLAKYMTKELRDSQEYDCKPGLRGWSYTRNALKPESEKRTVPSDYTLSPPAGSVVILEERKRTEFGSYHIIMYWPPFSAPPATPRARRKRRRA